MSSLAEKLGYLSDTEFATQLLRGKALIPSDVDDTTAMVLDEIAKVGRTVQSFSGDKLVITPAKFRRYWRKIKESTSPQPAAFTLATILHLVCNANDNQAGSPLAPQW